MKRVQSNHDQVGWAKIVRAAAKTLLVTLVVAGAVPIATASAEAASVRKNVAWVYADQPTTPSYRPAHNIINQNTGTSVVTRDGVGAYRVDFPGLASSHGNAIAGVVDSSSASCQVANWGPVGTAERVSVACFDRSGARADAKFNVVFSDKTYTRTGRLDQAYLWADRHDLSLNTPYVPQHVYSTNGTQPTVWRTGTGRYVVSVLTRANPAVAHVSAFGTSAARCQVESTTVGSSELRITVKCSSPTGSAKNTRFALNYGEEGASEDVVVGASPWAVHDRPSEPLNTTYTPTQRGGTWAQVGGYWELYHQIAGVIRTDVGQYKVNATAAGASSLDKIPVVTTTGNTDGHCSIKTWSGGSYGDGWIKVTCRAATGNLQDQTFNITYLNNFQLKLA